MSERTLRDRLLQTVESAREQERFFVEHSDDQPSRVPGRWTAKDHVAHLTSWREHAADVLEAEHRGEEHVEDFDVDARNAETYARTNRMPARDVIDAQGRSYDRLVAAIAACSEDSLRAQRQGRPGPVWKVVPGNGHFHVGQHLMQWHLEQGDSEAAERAADWVHGLDLLFDDPRSQAEANYNLACFRVRFGHEDEAVELLRQSLETDDGALRAWAREDGDLASLRSRPDVQALLAG